MCWSGTRNTTPKKVLDHRASSGHCNLLSAIRLAISLNPANVYPNGSTKIIENRPKDRVM
jgi:hypothetical protein